MRLLFLTNFYPPYVLGGYELLCQEMAAALAQRGHSLCILTSRHGVVRGSAPEDANVDSLQVLRSLHLITSPDYYNPWRFFTRWRLDEAHNHRQLLAAIADFQPDLTVVWGMWNLSLQLPFWAERRLPGRVVYYISSYWPTDTDPHRAYWNLPANSRLGGVLKQPLRKWAVAQLQAEGYPPALRYEHAVCCSRYVRDTLAAAGAIPATSGVMYTGAHPEEYVAAAAAREPAADGVLRLLYFGRLIHDKGVHTILEALNILKHEGCLDRLQLTILGSGHPNYESYLHKLVQEHELSGAVSFVSTVPRGEVPQWLSRHDVFLFTSIWAEPLARNMMEAMAAGMFVIGSEVGGQPEILHNEVNGATYTAEDAAGLARQIKCALENPQHRAELAAAGQSTALRGFTFERMVDEMEEWLGSIAGNIGRDVGFDIGDN